MVQRGATNTFNYIDDFITVGTPLTSECERNPRVMHEICTEVGLPYEPEKDEGPASTITFLGIEIDSTALELRLPTDKLGRLRTELGQWRGRKGCKKRELLSLIGSLSHACKVVRAGRSFLRRLIDLSTIAKHINHFIRINREARLDIEWWFQFCEQWNGVAMMRTGGAKQLRQRVGE